MKTYITENFLLGCPEAERLYHEYAANMPIIDYHCHLPPKEIAENKRYRSLTEIWLDGDHYKWRAIRTAGYNETDITGHIGDPSYDRARFDTWAEVVPQTLGNPLHHWAHLELLRYFGEDSLLCRESASAIYERANETIAQPWFTSQGLIKKFGLKYIGTTDDPADSLEYHQALKSQGIGCIVAPSWRPDRLIKIGFPGFKEYIALLSGISGIVINSIETLMAAISVRMEHFKSCGCGISDHGLDEFSFTRHFSIETAEKAFKKALSGESPSHEETVQYKSYILTQLGQKYSEYGWVMQLHIGALRNNNSRLFTRLGADVGGDSINDKPYAQELSAFLDTLDSAGALPKTILYSLNPCDNEMLCTMAGNFQGGGVPGKVQFGSAWWFNDQKDGMERQIAALSSMGLLPRFIGMLTDSRSFLSFPRHEYFRRLLCSIMGGWVKNGLAPRDFEGLGKIVQDISYNNAEKYFGIS